jgi:hypothetical protein
MSLDAQTTNGKTVEFSFAPTRPEIEMYHEYKRTIWGYGDFCREIKQGWETYLDGTAETLPLGDQTFAVWPDFAGITHYFLSDGHGVQIRGTKLDLDREELLYWLKLKLTRREEEELRSFNNDILGNICYHLNKPEEQRRRHF